MDILQRIVQAKRAELARDIEALPMRRVVEMAGSAPVPRDFLAALRRPGRLNVIAEIKRASPSRGGIRAEADVGAMARAYGEGGAVALSVLTERQFFLGDPAHLAEAKNAAPLPALRKDFIVDEYQVYQSRALGADAFLLIARLLEAKNLERLIGVGRSLEMEALVEVHAEDEVRAALDAGARIVGVNNRDLATLQINLECSLRLAALLPESVVRVSESGIESRADLLRLRQAGYDAYLVGERLMRDSDPAAALRALIGEGAA